MTNTALNCIIIDDSALQSIAVSQLINNHTELNLIEKYSNGIVTQKELQSKKIDLIFLDIEMPVINGFDFLDALETMKGLKVKPQIVLITNTGDYALKAFNYSITDYLKKPIEKDRFLITIDRVLKNHKQIHGIQQNQDYIIVNSNLQKNKIILNNINWIEALGDYVKIITSTGNYLVLSTMKAFLTRLPNNKFLRIHKSYIINIDKIENFTSTSVEICATKLPLSRAKKDYLENILEYM